MIQEYTDLQKSINMQSNRLIASIGAIFLFISMFLFISTYLSLQAIYKAYPTAKPLQDIMACRYQETTYFEDDWHSKVIYNDKGEVVVNLLVSNTSKRSYKWDRCIPDTLAKDRL